VAAQQPGAEGVEGTDRQVGQRGGGDQALQPGAHLAGGLVRESHRQDGPWRDREVPDEVGDTVRQDARLAGAGPGQDQQRARGVDDGLALLRIERVEDRVGHLPMLGRHLGCG